MSIQEREPDRRARQRGLAALLASALLAASGCTFAVGQRTFLPARGAVLPRG